MSTNTLATFRRHAETMDLTDLVEIFADDVLLHSPTHPAPLRGKEMAAMCMGAALGILHSGTFRVVRDLVGESSGMMEFETDIDGEIINGADLLRWNADGLITELKVLVRPRDTANLFCDKMTAEVSRLLAPK